DKTFLDHYLLGSDVSGFLKPWEYGRLNTVERVLLAQRVAGEQERAARHLDDMLRLLPPNLDRQLFQFNVGVFANGLDSDDTVATRVLEERLKREKDKLTDLTTRFDKPGDGGQPDQAKTPAAEPAAPPGLTGGLRAGGGTGRPGGMPESMGGKKEATPDGRGGAQDGQGGGGEGQAC